jgi:hypothetical protein
MSKQEVHFAAIGYEPLRMKPVHFATGFFLSLINQSHDLEWLNKVAVVKANKGLLGDYVPERLLELLKEQGRVDPDLGIANLKYLRTQVNGVVNNDEAAYPAFRPYSPSGNDYTLLSAKLITSERRTDGYSGHLIHRVLERSTTGQQVLEFARQWISRSETTLEHLVEPLLDEDGASIPWENRYPEIFGDLTDQRLDAIAALMENQTVAIARLCGNLQVLASHQTKLRDLVVGLCAWLFLYLQKTASDDGATSLLVMDFLGGENRRLRTQSRNSFTRRRELFFGSYQKKWNARQLACNEAAFDEVRATKFKFLEQHFSDLAVRIGFAQPRATQARRKHFELQPDTARMLVMSVIGAGEIRKLQDVAQLLRGTWGACFGGCDDDQSQLQTHGYSGLDQDADLEPNAELFISLLKRLNLAIEPSDGLVLCAANPEELL